MRTDPAIHRTTGFFVAIFQRTGPTPVTATKHLTTNADAPPAKKKKKPAEERPVKEAALETIEPQPRPPAAASAAPKLKPLKGKQKQRWKRSASALKSITEA